jgi:hypothetical protein
MNHRDTKTTEMALLATHVSREGAKTAKESIATSNVFASSRLRVRKPRGFLEPVLR